MKKIFTLVCAAVLTCSMANAELIFQESFDGKNGTVGQLSVGPNVISTNPTVYNDDYFDGVNYDETRWWTALGSSNFIKVEEGSLSYSGYQTGIGNKAYIWSTGADDFRSFSSHAVKNGKVYLAAIINVDAVKTNASPDYFISLCDHANGYYLGRIYAKSIKDGDNWVGFKLGVAKSNDGENYLRYTSEVFTPENDVLVVIEYEFVAGEKNDIVRLYVNPTKETTACTLECVQDTVTGGGIKKGAATQADAGVNGLFGVFLRQGTNTPKVYVDEIKVATAWSDLWTEGEGEQPEDDGTVENIAALKAYELMKGRTLKSQPVVVDVNKKNGAVEFIAIQDESGAILVDDNSGSNLLNGFNIGDRLDKLTAMMTQDQKNGFVVARISSTADRPTIVSEGNSVEPFEVSLAEAAKYGPALVQLTGVEFITTTEKQFTATSFEIKQGEAEAKLVVPEECDIINDDIPEKADIKALVVLNEANDVRIRISASADVTNRVERHETGVESIQDSELKSRKAIIDGQIVIIKGGKIYNVLGTEL